MHKSRFEGNAFQVRVLAAAVASCFVSAALANPTGGVPVQGVVSFDATIPGQLHITNSPNSIIHWNGFSIGAGELTTFIQQSASSAVLNRVVTPGSLSEILGTLQSNGRVFLINPNGITIGAGAMLDLPGFVASSLDMTDADFTAGRMRFQQAPGAPAGAVTNQANIFMPDGGQLYLVGGSVINEPGGFINSPNGEVILAAGHSMELMSAAAPGVSVVIAAPENEAVNLGQIFAASGQVGIFGGVVHQGGMVNANAAFLGPNGTIQLRATDATTLAAGSTTTAGDLQIDTGSLAVAGLADSWTQAIHASDGVVVENAPGGFAQLSAQLGQSIEAGFVEVNAVAGGSASIFSFGGEQRITTTGTNVAGEGMAVRSEPGGFASVSATGGNQSIDVRNAESAVIDGGLGTAFVTNNNGVQTFSVTGGGANALWLGASGGSGQSVIGGSGFQTVRAGNPGERGSINIIGPHSGMPSSNVAGGTQTVSTSGTLNIVGGSAGGPGPGISHNGTGQQTVEAQALVLQGGSGGSGGAATINSVRGAQQIDAGSVSITGGADGTNNFAFIRSQSASQSIHAGTLSVQAGAGGTSNFAAILGAQQTLTVGGDATVSGGASESGALGGGALIGGGGSLPTNLTLTAGGSVTLIGGANPGSGAVLGASNAGVQRTDIVVRAGGDVSMNPGTGTGTRIGAAPGNSLGGAIEITAGGTIHLGGTGPADNAVIRTADGVTLTAPRVSQDPEAQIEAGSLATHTGFGADLGGANSVKAFRAANWGGGDVVLHNESDELAVSSIENFNGGLTLQQTGDLRVTGLVFTGVQDVDVTGGLIVQNEPFAFAQFSATGGQSIDAGYVEVIGSVGDGMAGGASISNFGGDQRIATSGANDAGESLVLRSSSGAAAGIISGSGQQSILLAGSGPNALVMESADGMFGSGTGIFGDTQMIVAGNAGESGSITLRGPISQITSSPLPGGSQTVTTSGTLTLAGSDTEFSFGPAGIFAFSPDGVQTVRAESIQLRGGNGGNGAVIAAIDGSQLIEAGAGGIGLAGAAAPGNGGAAIVQQSSRLSLSQTVRSGGAIVLQGGSAGSGNSAVIVANGGAQTVEAGAGGLALRGGEAGSNNLAMINQASTEPAATQTISSAGPVLLEGGSGGFNFAMIRAFGGHQTFEAGDTTLLAGAGGIDNFSTLQGRVQDVTVYGDLAIVARGSGGSPTVGGGARIGGLGGAVPSATNLALDVGGNLTMTAGSVLGTGVSLGGNIVDDLPSNIALTVGGNVTLNGGTAPGTFARVGSASSGATGGSIEIAAGGTIALNSTAPDQASIIRTTGDVALTAQRITQGGDARIEAASLTAQTAQGTMLSGANSVNELAMLNSASGDVAFNNTSALLTVTGIHQVPHGALVLSQDGDLLISGDVTSGAQTISATGDMTVSPGVGPNVAVEAHGAQTFNVGGSFGLLASDAWNGYARTQAHGPVSITTGGDLAVRAGGGLLAYALLYGSDDLHLTVGDALRIDGGTGLLALARIQTDFGQRIHLSFPNRESGGYFVDGREGVTHRGLDGFFTGLLPAIRNRSLVVSYGE